MTELERACDQISEIHKYLAKTEVYRGFRAVPVALSGGVGLLGGLFQSRFVGEQPGLDYVHYWSAIAVIACAVALSGAVINYVRTHEVSYRRKTRHVIGQFAPSLATGLLLTVVFCGYSADLIPLLPGVWAVLFSLGLFAARPYLPHNIGWLALAYLAAGALLLLLASGDASLSPWGTGGVFGLGQIVCSAILYWDLERNNHGS